MGSAVREWALCLESHLDQPLARDAASASGPDPAIMRRSLEALFLSSAGLGAHNILFEAAGIDRTTAGAAAASPRLPGRWPGSRVGDGDIEVEAHPGHADGKAQRGGHNGDGAAVEVQAQGQGG